MLPREGHATGGHHWFPPERLAEEPAESRGGSPTGGHKWCVELWSKQGSSVLGRGRSAALCQGLTPQWGSAACGLGLGRECSAESPN